MPIYFCHGFRWQRQSIRVYVVVQDLDDASPDSIITPNSSQCLLDSFYRVFDFLPDCSPPPPRSRSRSPLQSSSFSTTCCLTPQSWSPIKLLEEYDPHDLSAVSRPYAYVADYAVRIDLSASISDHIAAYEAGGKGKSATSWFEKLRDQLQRNAEIKWYIVVNGDEVRDFSSLNDSSYSSDSNSSKTSRARDYNANRDADLPDGHDYNDGDDKDEKGSVRTTRGPQKQQKPADPEAMGQYNLTLQKILFAENRDSNGEVKGKKEQPDPPPPPPENHHRHQNQKNQSRSQSSLGAGGGSGAKTTGGPSTSSSTPSTSRSDSLEAKVKQSPEGNSNSKPRSGLKRLFGRGRSVANTDD